MYTKEIICLFIANLYLTSGAPRPNPDPHYYIKGGQPYRYKENYASPCCSGNPHAEEYQVVPVEVVVTKPVAVRPVVVERPLVQPVQQHYTQGGSFSNANAQAIAQGAASGLQPIVMQPYGGLGYAGSGSQAGASANSGSGGLMGGGCCGGGVSQSNSFAQSSSSTNSGGLLGGVGSGSNAQASSSSGSRTFYG